MDGIKPEKGRTVVRNGGKMKCFLGMNETRKSNGLECSFIHTPSEMILRGHSSIPSSVSNSDISPAISDVERENILHIQDVTRQHSHPRSPQSLPIVQSHEMKMDLEAGYPFMSKGLDPQVGAQWRCKRSQHIKIGHGSSPSPLISFVAGSSSLATPQICYLR